MLCVAKNKISPLPERACVLVQEVSGDKVNTWRNQVLSGHDVYEGSWKGAGRKGDWRENSVYAEVRGSLREWGLR